MITLRAVLTEGALLAVFAAGLALSRALDRRWHPAELINMFAIGVFFELLTAHLWTYRNVFIILPTPIDTDISLLVSLGWVGMITAATSTAEAAWARWEISAWWKRHLVLALAWLAFGFCMETTFYNIGLIEYADIPWTYILGQVKPLPPTNYLAGYGLVPPLFTWFFLWLEKGLAARA